MGSSHFSHGDAAGATRPAAAAFALAAVWFAVVNSPLALAGEPSAAPAVDRTAAERGYRLLTTKLYQRVDITPDLFEKLWQQWPAADRKAAGQATADERRRMAFSRYGLIAAPDHPQGPPLGAVLGEKGGWALNCLGCHGGKVAGRAMPGLGNSHYAFQTLSEEMYAARRPPGEKSLMSKAASALAPPLGKSNGTTNAQTFSVLLCARRDLDLNASADKPLPKFQHYDLDPPPLWNTKKKDRLYIDGFVKKTPRAIMQFVLTPENSGATVRGWEQDFIDILAWIESLEPPKYPSKVDGALAAAGKPIFERTCSECHGTYGPEGTYPERRVALDEIGTDDARLKGMPAEHRRFMRDSWLGYYGKYDVVEEPDGYVAPPLDGVWASAPYFHNGSVPTLWHVLHAESRPRVWLRSEDGYDEARVGLEVSELAELPASAQDGAERRRYFDTRLRGKSAAGHRFPEQLSEEEKRAVLEYLKTL